MRLFPCLSNNKNCSNHLSIVCFVLDTVSSILHISFHVSSHNSMMRSLSSFKKKQTDEELSLVNELGQAKT